MTWKVMADHMDPWWFKHITAPALKISCDVKKVNDFVDGDALPASATQITDSHTATPGGMLTKPPPQKKAEGPGPALLRFAHRLPAPRSKVRFITTQWHPLYMNKDGCEF